MRATATTAAKMLAASPSRLSTSKLSKPDPDVSRTTPKTKGKLSAAASSPHSKFGPSSASLSRPGHSTGASDDSVKNVNRHSGSMASSGASAEASARLAVNFLACEDTTGRRLPHEAIVLGSIFSFQHKGIVSIEGIQACSHVLVELYLQGNRIHSFKDLGTMPNLVVMDLQSNFIESFLGAQEQPKIKYISLLNNPISRSFLRPQFVPQYETATQQCGATISKSF